MNATTHAAHILDNRRAAQLDRENELLRRHAERAVDADRTQRPTGLAVVTGWFTKSPRPAAARTAH